MAQGQISNIVKQRQVEVTCGNCRHFHRDTTGPSFNADTHIYFMGICNLGLKPHSPIKQFADKLHICKSYAKNLHTS